MSNPLRNFMILLFLIAAAGSLPGESLTDSYEILNRHYEAMGGLEKLKAQETSHLEGELVLEGTGLEGSFEQWSESPIKSRQEVDLKIITQVSGDNGEFAWTVDQNDKLQIHNDARTLDQRQLQILLAEYDHLDPNSEVFNLSYEGLDTASGSDCYVVKIANNINEDYSNQYYDTSSFMLLKTVAFSPEGENRTWYSDYRDVDGVPFAFMQRSIQSPSGMKSIVNFTRVEINVPIDPALFEPPSTDVEDFRFTNGKSAEDIPFRYIDHHIYLPVEVGGKTKLWILDTGASASVIDEDFARELGLELEGQMKGQGAGKLVDVSFTTLPAFSLPGLEFDEQSVASIKIAPLFRRWLGMEVVGILGYDFLSRVVTKVDYANEMLSFYHPDSFSYQGDGVVLSTPISQRNMLELPVIVDDEYVGLWSLDLGAGGMSYHYPYAEEHGLLDASGVDWLGHGAGGSHPIRRLQSKTMEFAGFTVKDIEVSVPLEKGEGAFGHTQLTGNIGNTLLQHFVLYLDYEREQVIVERGDDFDTDFPEDNSGMQLANNEGDSLQVIFVAHDTPASKAGIEADDIILAVNDVEVDDLGGISAVKKFLRKDPGTELTFDVVRGGEIKKLTLTLEDLFK